MLNVLNDAQYGFLGAFRGTKHSNTCSGEGSNVGIAIFWRGGCFPTTCSQQGPYGNQGNEQGNEQRGWICGYSGAYTAVYCSTHLTSNDDVVAQAQMADYRLKSTGARNAYGLRAVMMGDFNLEPNQPNVGMAHWYVSNNYHLEGDKCNTDGDSNLQTGCEPTFRVYGGYPLSLDDKLDYSFATRGQAFCFRQGSPPGWFGSQSFSDHRFYRAYINCDPVV